tara:strand:+ start:651 stop:1034 length:384 start_codon:yes stop_codon:yes gene_type:complete
MTELPGILAEIAQVAGEDAAQAIAAERGGTEIYVPPAPAADHWLSRLVGHARALAIGEHLTCGIGGARVEVPLGNHGHQAQARRQVDAMIDAGKWSERDIARATGYTIRGVRKRIAMRRDDRQLNLL